jgi:hypothetical protein
VQDERLDGSQTQRDLIEPALVDCLSRQGKTDEAKRLLPMRRPLIDFRGACTGIALFICPGLSLRDNDYLALWRIVLT